MATSFRICGRPTIGVFDHQVGINRKDLRCDDGLDDGQAPRQVRNKMVVHHVNVSNVRAGNLREFATQIADIAVKNRRRNSWFHGPYDTWRLAR